MPSENGWHPAWVGGDALEWVTVPGTNVRLQFQKGQPLKILRALAADFNAYVEPLRDRDSASYTPTNSVATSNHLNGTAMDLNWDSHPFHAKGTFNAKQMKTIRELLDFYEGTVFWAGDWKSPIDEMHWQMGYDTFNNPNVASFIKRKIRSDGFSTFRRGATEAAKKEPVKEVAVGEKLYESVSIYKTPGEGARYTLAELIQSIDGLRHRETVEDSALLGSVVDIDRIVKVAAGKGAYTDDNAVKHAQAFLVRLEKENPEALKSYLIARGKNDSTG